MKYFSVLFSALLGFSSLQAAVIDQGNTLVTVESKPSDLTAFDVTIIRSDKILDDNELIAARSISMVFNFHIKDNKLHYENDVVPSIGDKPKVTTAKAIFVRDDIEPSAVNSLFAEGIVGVEISSKIENTLIADEANPDKLVFARHITLHERILELDGNKIRQSDIFEHVIDLDQDGKVVRVISDPILASQITAAVGKDTGVSSGLSSCEDFFESIDVGNFIFQILLIGLSALLTVAVIRLFLLAHQLYKRRGQTAYEPVGVSELPPSYNDKDVAIFNADIKSTDSTNVVESEGEITVLTALTTEHEHDAKN